MHEGLIGVLSSLVEHIFIATNYSLGTKFDMKVLVSGVFEGESNSIGTRLANGLSWVTADDIKLLIDFLSFLNDVLTAFEEAWFKSA